MQNHITAIRFTASLAALLIGVTLAGCSSTPSSSPSTSPSPSPSATPHEVVIDDRPLEQQLADAIRNQDEAYVAALIEAGVDVNTELAPEIRPLHIASVLASVEITEALIAAGADLEARTNTGATALLRAAESGTGDMAAALVLAGAEVEVFTMDTFGSSPLHVAAQTKNNEALLALLNLGANPDIPDLYFLTPPIGVAAFNDNLEGVRMLVDAGADPDIANATGATALSLARAQGYTEIVDYLVGIGAAE